MIKEQQRKIIEETKKLLMEKTFASREFSVIARAKTFANFEFRLRLGRNFREKRQKKRENLETFCPRKFLPQKYDLCSAQILVERGSHNKVTFETLLARSGSNSTHIKIYRLMTEIFKSMNHWNLSLVWEFYEKKPMTYNPTIQNLCKLPTIKALGFGLDSKSFRGSFLWNTFDDSIKQEPIPLIKQIK